MASQAAIMLLIAYLFTFAFGWRIPFATGLPGALIVVVIAALFGIAFSGLSNTVALRTKNTETTMMVSFTLTFPLLFLSTAMLPSQLLPHWVQDFSKVNPVSYVANAARSLILTGYDWTAIGKALLAVGVLGVILNSLAIMAFRAQGK
jgi:ABC-2 type transport system permease protein